jgi:hypothetical protein
MPRRIDARFDATGFEREGGSRAALLTVAQPKPQFVALGRLPLEKAQ